MRDDRGGVLVEFALASILFFATVFGTIEFGRAIWQYNMVASLAQEGARWASVRGATSGSPASAADVATFVQSRAVGLNVAVTTTPAPSSLSSGSTVTVVVTKAFTPATALIPNSTLTLTSTARMVMAR